MNKIYLVERIEHYGTTAEGIPIEDTETVGFFSNKKLADKAKAKCAEAGIAEETVRVTEFHLNFGNTQKYVFVLMYEYYYCADSKAEYYYTFAPRTSEEECLMLRNRMLLTSEYRPAPNKHYYETSDGFRIIRYPINYIRL